MSDTCGRQFLVICAVGPDRPGIAEEISEFLCDRGGNLEESRMVNLHGQFALMVLVSGSAEVIQQIQEHRSLLEQDSGLKLICESAQPGGVAPADSLPYRLRTYCMDREGIFHQVTHLLRQRKVNIESAQTHVSPAPHTGAPVFSLEATISVPRSCPVADLRESLKGLCDELNIDFILEPVHAG